MVSCPNLVSLAFINTSRSHCSREGLCSHRWTIAVGWSMKGAPSEHVPSANACSESVSRETKYLSLAKSRSRWRINVFNAYSCISMPVFAPLCQYAFDAFVGMFRGLIMIAEEQDKAFSPSIQNNQGSNSPRKKHIKEMAKVQKRMVRSAIAASQ